MAGIKCPSCGNHASGTAAVCPRCGAAMAASAASDPTPDPSGPLPTRSKWQTLLLIGMFLAGVLMTTGAVGTVGPDIPTTLLGLLLIVAAVLIFVVNEIRNRKQHR